MHWSHQQLPHLSVNGLFVTESDTRSQFSRTSEFQDGRTNDEVPFRVRHPSICIDDPDGQFPLNVRRSDITEDRYPFEEDLFADVIDDFLSYMIVSVPDGAKGEWPRGRVSHPGVRQDIVVNAGPFGCAVAPAIFRPDGISPLIPTMAGACDAEVVYVALPTKRQVIDYYYTDFKPSIDLSFLKLIPPGAVAFAIDSFRSHQLPGGVSFDELASVSAAFIAVGGAYDEDASTWETSGSLATLVGARAIRGARIVCPRSSESCLTDYENLLKKIFAESERVAEKRGKALKDDKRLQNSIRDTLSRIHVSGTLGEHIELTTVDCPGTRLNIETIARGESSSECIVELFLTGENRSVRSQADGLLSRRWREIVTEIFIPFDPQQRQAKCERAYDALGEFIKVHQLMSRSGFCV